MIKLILVHRGTEIAKQWARHLGEQPNVQILETDICQVPCGAIVSPANSFGFMDGGLDYALSERFGWDLQERLQQLIREKHAGELLVGQAEILPTNDQHVPWLVSAPTMRVPMHVKTTVNAYLAMRAALFAVQRHDREPAIETVAVPSLCTGVGGMRPDIAALQMWCAYEEVVLGKARFPGDFGEAQNRQLRMNPLGMIYE